MNQSTSDQLRYARTICDVQDFFHHSLRQRAHAACLDLMDSTSSLKPSEFLIKSRLKLTEALLQEAIQQIDEIDTLCQQEEAQAENMIAAQSIFKTTYRVPVQKTRDALISLQSSMFRALRLDHSDYEDMIARAKQHLAVGLPDSCYFEINDILYADESDKVPICFQIQALLLKAQTMKHWDDREQLKEALEEADQLWHRAKEAPDLRNIESNKYYKRGKHWLVELRNEIDTLVKRYQ